MSASSLAIQAGAKAAEVASVKREIAGLKAKVDALKAKAAATEKKIREGFAKFGVKLPDDFGKEDLDLAFAFVDAYNVRAKQLVDQMVTTAGFQTADEVAVAKKIFG